MVKEITLDMILKSIELLDNITKHKAIEMINKIINTGMENNIIHFDDTKILNNITEIRQILKLKI